MLSICHKDHLYNQNSDEDIAPFSILIYLRACKVDLLVTCLSLQKTMIGDTLGGFVSFFRIILLNCIQVFPDY